MVSAMVSVSMMALVALFPWKAMVEIALEMVR